MRCLAEDTKMNGKMGMKILAILLSGAICISNCPVESFASEMLANLGVESEIHIEEEIEATPEEIESTDSEQGNQEELENTDPEQGNESIEENVEESAEENIEEVENTEDTMMTMSGETKTFSTLAELEVFYNNNKAVYGLENALIFPAQDADKNITANANGLILLSCVEGEDASFAGYTITLSGLAGSTSNMTASITKDALPTLSFLGLGREEHPFKGTITVSEAITDGSLGFILGTPFFNAIDVTTAKLDKITTLNLQTASQSKVVLAQTVSGSGQDWSNVEVNIKAYKIADNESVTYTYPGSCIGLMKEGTNFSLGKISYDLLDEGADRVAEVKSESEDAGLLCNTMETGSGFTVNNIGTFTKNVNVTSVNGAAGGLVGRVERNAVLSVGTQDGAVIDEKWKITGKNAGGLIGEATDATLNLNAKVNGAKVITNVAAGSAGGVIGTYHLTSDASEAVFQSYDGTAIQMTKVVLDATGTNSYIGGLFGVLELSEDFSIHGNINAPADIIRSAAGFTKNGSNYVLSGYTTYGGLAGRVYSTDSSDRLPALILDGNISSESTTQKDITYYGGLIGIVGKADKDASGYTGIDSANFNGAYVVINNQVSTTCNNSQKIIDNGHYFGGAVGGMFYHSVLEIAENASFSPTASSIKCGGGIVGVAGRGSTLRLAGSTNLTWVSFLAHERGQNPGKQDNYRYANGQIVGVQNAAVIYAAKTWVLTRPDNPGEIDDIGNYGSVIRLGKNIGKGNSELGEKGGLSETLIIQDTNTHKTVFGEAASLNNGEISISSADQFALLSIAEQTYGDFGIYPTVTKSHIISNNKMTKIVLSDDIDLSNTGISGLQRDFYYASDVYTGELDGQGNTLTLDIGQVYANNGDGAGNGQIHGHSQVGLFSQTKNDATIKNLTIGGNINIRERRVSGKDQKSTIAVGGCVAFSNGNISFENVTTNVTIQCVGNGTESVIGGLIGLKQGTDSSVAISNCTGNAIIKDTTSTGEHTVGGLIGGYTSGGTITVSNTKLTGNITGGSIADAKYGGLISVIKEQPVEMTLNNVTIDGQKIENSATSSSGGLLGYEWNNSTVYFGDSSSIAVTVQGESSVIVNGNAAVGALVYQATGYWQVNNLSFVKADIQNQAGDLGLLICHGRKGYDRDAKQGAELLYLEETKYHAYQISADNVTVSSTGGDFDEWIVYTAESAKTITENGNSVISIATKVENDKRKGFDPTGDTSTGYQNRTKNKDVEWSAANPNARYYYDLDVIRANANNTVDNYVSTPEELVLWSVWRYCEKVQDSSGAFVNSNIQQYFATDDIILATIDGDSKLIDLTGYSYYPANVDAANAEIKNCTIKFANQIIEDAENKTGTGLDTMNRTTFGTEEVHTQHYLMHSGLILYYRNTSTTTGSVTLSVSNVTLQGSIGKGPDATGSGAIICGTVAGSNTGGSHFANIKLNSVTLDGLNVNSDMTTDGYAPLLINTVGSYGGIDAQTISTLNYDPSKKAATSLIGHVGDEYATNISLAFSNRIALNGRTSKSIFSHATLLESFQYSGSSSSGYYHFNEGEEFTYGREISGSIENENQQKNYFDTGNPVKDGTTTNFNTSAYLPYVCQTKVTEQSRADTFHELEINIVKPDLDEGCGTYDDPYIIRQSAQLQLVAQYIARDAAQSGWKINMVTDREKIRSESDENHKTYTYGNGSWTSGTETCEQSDMRNYLRNAYYKINNDLELNKFEGLGTTTYPFRGVVEGNSKTVTIDAQNITSGFVNVSYGSVIQNLNITYIGEKILTNTKAVKNSNTVADESYFGGIIGDVKGGDNLIRNVSVVYQDVSGATDNFKISVQNHLQCVGGFLGIVEGGGVILSEMSQPDGLKQGQTSIVFQNKNPEYVSPLVGRVLDGFVLNETSESTGALTSKAGSDKNYSIGNIPADTSLSVTVQSGNILEVTIDREEELLLLSSIINSGFCSAGYSLSYQKQDSTPLIADSGKVRNADYSQIGNINVENFKTRYFEPSRNDDAKTPAATNPSYLVTKYADRLEHFWDLCTPSKTGTIPNKYLNLDIQNNLDMSVYKNGYRGIGGRYNCTASSPEKKPNSEQIDQKTGQFQRNTPVFAPIDGIAINGNSHVLTVDNQINGYSDDNYVANAAGGLINVLRRKQGTSITIQNLTVKGFVELHDFSDQSNPTAVENASGRNYTASVGGVIGRYFTEEGSSYSTQDTIYLTLDGLRVSEISLYSDGATGGLIGQTGITYFYIFGNGSVQYVSGVNYQNCGYEQLDATSCNATGGFVGAACGSAAYYKYNANNGVKNSNGVFVVYITNKIVLTGEEKTNLETGKKSTLRVYAKAVSENGLGGLIGSVGSNVEINKDGTRPLVLEQITLQDSKVSTSVSRTGGAIGFLHHGTTKAYNITISNSELGNKEDDNLGGIVGCWYSPESGGVMDNIVIDGCKLDGDLSVAGVIGYIDKGAKVVTNITVKNTEIVQRSTSTSRGVALVVGQIAGGGIFGENILLKSNKIDGKTPNKGRIVGLVGSSGNLPIQLLGVSVQYGNDKDGNPIDVSKQPKEDIGSIPYANYPDKTSKIFISYDAFLTGKTLGSELDHYPNVAIEGIGSTDKITGDTATPYTITGSADLPGIVKKEGTAYVYIGEGKNYQNVNTSSVDKLVPGIVSTYNANQDTKIAVEKDFEVVQIDGSAACLKQYLNVATNGAFDMAVRTKVITEKEVQVERYQWDSIQNKFKNVTDATKPTLTYDSSDGSFYATAQYDNQKNMFTLVSVTFKTTSNGFSRTYHIPVVVRRMLQVDFMATMVSGTVFNAEEMEGYKTHALASVGEEITGYLTFKYNSNLSGQEATYDWQSYMESGESLLGYYKKSMDTGDKELPEGTQITLIDCQQSERRYYAKVPEGKTSELEIYNGNNLEFKTSKNDPYEPVTLAELLKISAKQIVDVDFKGKKWVSLGGRRTDGTVPEGATVVDQAGIYYRLYKDTDSEIQTTDCFELEITEPKPEENYFVVISIPKAENHMLTLIKSGGITKGSLTWSDSTASAPPTEIHQLHRYKDSNNKYTQVDAKDANQSSEITFNFLDNYKQTLKDLLYNSEAIPVTSADSFVEMKFELQNEISFEPDHYEEFDPLYQELRVSLQKTIDETASDVYFPSDAKAKVALYAYYLKDDNKVYFKVNDDGNLIMASDDDYRVDEEGKTIPPAAVSYDWVAGNDGNMVLPFATLNNGVYQYVDLSPIRNEAKKLKIKTFYIETKLSEPITIGTSSVINNDLFPTREIPESKNQTEMQFTSVLSFKESGLSYSTLRGSTVGNRYYLNEKREAVLKLDYLNVDQLGINLSDEHSGEINAVLTLDFSGAEGFNSNLSKFEALNDADTVVFDFSLQQKGNGNLSSVNYGDVSIGAYLTGASITGGDSIDSFRLKLEKTNDIYPYYNESTGVFTIPITFIVNTTTEIIQYANYRIYASAKLLKDEQPKNMAVNAEKAFITYTVAKININGIWSKPTDGSAPT